MEVDSPLIVSPPLTIDNSSHIATKLDLQLTLTDGQIVEDQAEQVVVQQANSQPEDEIEDESEEEQEEEADYEFSFACADASSPISAEDLFDHGQIKPVFPWLGNDAVTEPLNAGEEVGLESIPVFVERRDLPATSSCSEAEDIGRVAEGPYCAWSKRTGESTSSAPESCRKSNSTGFSKLRRFRDLLHRSQSDGKDTFVFLTTEKKAEKEETASEKAKKSRSGKGKEESKTTPSRKAKTKTTSSLSSYAMQYGEKAKEKRRSYLPYRVGFFTNANAMSKNIHPY